MSIKNAISSVKRRFSEIEAELTLQSLSHKADIALSKEFALLKPLVDIAIKIEDIENELSSLSILIETESQESELFKIAKEEYTEKTVLMDEFTKEFRIALCPKNEDDSKNAIIEIRAGTGGSEAALFAADLYRMYQRLAERKGWKMEVVSISMNEIGGYKEIICSINGTNVFSFMKFESGVHRVQRVPETESAGRLHTSAATVAVLPEVEEVDLSIDEKDLKIESYRSSGPGGQSVNTTDSAVRITHIPTGIVVSQQDEKSQHKNKAKAMKILRARLYEEEKRKKEAERSNLRKGQIGSGDRSERIRTYNFPQSRVTDHRVNLTLYKLDSILREGSIDEITDALLTREREEQLKNSSPWDEEE